jgi:ABC-type transporter Mla MlaB component
MTCGERPNVFRAVGTTIALGHACLGLEPAMLMITRLDANDRKGILKLEGKLLAPWIGELQTACRENFVKPSQVILDLRGVTFVDAEGTRFLASLIRDGAQVIGCSGFVAEMLHLKECT